jgi:NADP+-dependent farnesol dehydrogenase
MIVCGLTTHDGLPVLESLKYKLSNEKGKLVPMLCEVKDEGHVNPVFRYIGEQYDGIDLLICYANSMTKGLILSDNNSKDLREIMETNIIGLCMVAREGAKQMAQRSEDRKNIGHIIIITSTIGQIDAALPRLNPGTNSLYPASK